jgi:hypothetical protein
MGLPAKRPGSEKDNETGWRGWTIDVKDGDRQVWQIPFDATE